jgi:uncharacterized protein YjbJ (UPF0337 family)
MNDSRDGLVSSRLNAGSLHCPERQPQTGQLIRMLQEDHTMNKDIFEGKWKQMRGQAKDWWGKLTDDDLDRVGGKYDQFVGMLQEKYGYTRERAEEEINRRTAEYETLQKTVANPKK